MSAALVAGETIGLGQVVLDGDQVYWSEQRPRESGRNAIVRTTVSGNEDLLPVPFSARSRVHEYGGGAFTAARDSLFFCHDLDQRVYRRNADGEIVALTPESPSRYADLTPDVGRARLYSVREQHAGESEPRNTLVTIDWRAGSAPRTLVAGHDFYSSPRLAPDGRTLAWLAWNHPDMPWDGTELWLARIDVDGQLDTPQRIAGGAGEAVAQPLFAPDGTLYFVSDRNDWWNLYRWQQGRIEPVLEMAAEFAVPHWVFGQSNYAFLSAREIVCAYGQNGRWRLGRLDAARAKLAPIDMPYSEIAQVCCRGDQVYFVGASATCAPEVVALDLTRGAVRTLARANRITLDAGLIAESEAINFPTTGGATAHAFYYAPRNRDYQGPESEHPPLLVLSHGGPTAATASALNLRVQYFTTRGFAVLDVNYRGSSGYGRAYRRALDGQWGVADVDDCIAAARYVVAQGRADPARLAIRGSSAGGYTTLCALTFHDTFKAGASYYGISDLEALARDTHKFEAHYLDKLVGPYPAERARYEARSPIHHVERLNCPMVLFQGQLDKVVPPDQAERMVAALRRKGIPVAYVAFENEAHGFRRAENIEHALQAEFAFYARIFGIELAEAPATLAFENL